MYFGAYSVVSIIRKTPGATVSLKSKTSVLERADGVKSRPEPPEYNGDAYSDDDVSGGDLLKREGDEGDGENSSKNRGVDFGRRRPRSRRYTMPVIQNGVERTVF